ncbi:MAG: discoidin domain-containing protein [Bryobacteraceae bacterium]
MPITSLRRSFARIGAPLVAASTQTRDVLLSVLIAMICTALFYAEAIPFGSRYAGFVYTGDFWAACLASLAKLNSLVAHGVFSGIDYSTHGGASEFFLRPNLYPYHPLVLAYGVLFHPNRPEQLIRFSVLLLALHSCVGYYFTMQLVRRYLGMGIGLAIFVACGYLFSIQMVNALFYPPYVFCTAILPWAIYVSLASSDELSPWPIIRRSLPFFVLYTGGYVAIGVSCVVLAVGSTAVFILYVDRKDVSLRVALERLCRSVLPFALASVVAAPLYLAIVQFHALVQTASMSIFWSAHQLAEMPRTLLRLVSPNLYYTGPMFEFSLNWGIVPIIIAAVFVASLKNPNDLSDFDWRMMKFCGSVYMLIALSIFGAYSAVSDLLFFVPGIGTMHIYQRHLLAGHLFFVITIALMLKGLPNSARNGPAKTAFFVLFVLMATCAHLLATNDPEAGRLHINDYLIFDLFLGLIFSLALLVPGRHFVFLVAAFLILLAPLRRVYNYSATPGAVDSQRKQKFNLDGNNSSRLVAYFREHSTKTLIKYVDVTPALTDYFPKNYPWFVASEITLSSYNGYEMQLAARSDYLNRMVTTVAAGTQTWVTRPDWNWVARTGGDFVVFQEGDPTIAPRTAEFADVSDSSKVLRLPNKIVVAPLKLESVRRPPSFDSPIVRGRYVRVQQSGVNILSLAEVRVRGTLGGIVSDLARLKKARQSSSPMGSSGAAEKAIDGNTDGAFEKGSVTHTGPDKNAWWEVDLGSSGVIDSVEVWNRTDCCFDRLQDFWIFVSDQAFRPEDTPANLSGRSGVLSHHVQSQPNPMVTISPRQAAVHSSQQNVLFDNGYLRCLGDPGTANVKGFETDGAANMTLDVDVTRPVKVEYLFWPSARLKFSLEGAPVDVRIVDGLQTIDMPLGHHRLNIRYSNPPLTGFLWCYAFYGIGLVVACFQPLAVNPRFRRLLKRD